MSERSRQELFKLSERWFGISQLSDQAFREEISAAVRNGSAAGSAARVIERLRSGGENSCFFPSLQHRSAIQDIIAARFPEEREGIIHRAERGIAGRFDLLGFRDLDFGSPIDWRLEPVSGRSTPLEHWSKIAYLDPNLAGDKKITWELNRFAHFVAFGQAYWMTGDGRFAEAFVEQANAWMDANPVGLGINWASSLELAFRSIAWLWALHLMADSPALDARFLTRFLKCLIAHGIHIEKYLSTYFSPNTHLTGEALGLFYLGTALPELKRAPVWRFKGLEILLGQLPIQIRRDGVYFEQTTYYHRYTVDLYLHLAVLGRATGVRLPPVVEERLGLALDHLAWTARPGGKASLIGDDDGGRVIQLGNRALDDFRGTLSTGAALMGRGDWKLAAGAAAAETLWLLGPDAIERFDDLEQRPPDETARAFPDSGYFVMRDGWANDSTYALIDCGPHGVQSCGHAHADALSFEFSCGGTAWVVDPGTYTYTGDRAARDWFRSTAAHNSVTVDGEEQSLPADWFSWAHTAESSPLEFIDGNNFTYFEGRHHGYERLADPVTHNRSVLLVKGEAGAAESTGFPAYLLIRDHFDARGLHRYTARYHLGAGCGLSRENGHMVATEGTNSLRLLGFCAGGLAQRIEEGWVSRAYGERQAAPVAVFESEGAGDQRLVTFLLPGTTADLRAGSPGHATASAFSLSNGTTYDLVIVTPEGPGSDAMVEHEELGAQAELTVARFRNGRFASAFLSRGRRLEIAGRFALKSRTTIGFLELAAADEELQITIHGASRFELSFAKPPEGEPPASIVVNGARFSLSPESSTVAFALEGSGWAPMGRMTKEGSMNGPAENSDRIPKRSRADN